MSALETIEKLINLGLYPSNLKYCFVDDRKLPHKLDGSMARPNRIEDFFDLDEVLTLDELNDYKGLGISIQASKICAIDIDNCVEEPNNYASISELAKEIINLFYDYAYIEYSFSGTGIRILFDADLIEDYSSKYYVKNSHFGIEYYQPSSSFRYVTITGNCISNSSLDKKEGINKIVEKFLNKYMKRELSPYIGIKVKNIKKDERSIDDLLFEVKKYYIRNFQFQNLWFGKAPGSGSNESELDWSLLSCLFENITQDKIKLKQLFEMSPYFKTKDYKHISKWKYGEGRYFNYMYENLSK